jgi:hypothetical protein
MDGPPSQVFPTVSQARRGGRTPQRRLTRFFGRDWKVNIPSKARRQLSAKWGHHTSMNACPEALIHSLKQAGRQFTRSVSSMVTTSEMDRRRPSSHPLVESAVTFVSSISLAVHSSPIAAGVLIPSRDCHKSYETVLRIGSDRVRQLDMLVKRIFAISLWIAFGAPIFEALEQGGALQKWTHLAR